MKDEMRIKRELEEINQKYLMEIGKKATTPND